MNKKKIIKTPHNYTGKKEGRMGAVTLNWNPIRSQEKH
jgi:hypothetical protein